MAGTSYLYVPGYSKTKFVPVVPENTKYFWHQNVYDMNGKIVEHSIEQEKLVIYSQPTTMVVSILLLDLMEPMLFPLLFVKQIVLHFQRKSTLGTIRLRPPCSNVLVSKNKKWNLISYGFSYPSFTIHRR